MRTMNEAKEESSVAVLPEAGQLVEVRRRLWSVSEVTASMMPRSSGHREPQHLVTLVSLDEDALGEELEVVWELEPGARVIERAGLPAITGVDDAEELEAFLDAVRWGAATNADRGYLQAPFRSGITIEDYQLDPLVRAIDMARTSLLIADDVGLGKTIEAGLVIQELILRHRARTVLVVCPASLLVKWRDEMLEKFGLEFRIVDTDYIKHLRRTRGLHANPWTSFPRLITSMDWLKSGEPLRLMRDVLPHRREYPRKFDILVVDEAHNVAPAAASKYSIDSQRTRLIRAIAPHFEHKLFLTATPHNGYQESFTSLLELLDDQRFARMVMPDRERLARVMVRRLKTDLVDAEGKPIYPVRRLMPLEIDYTDEERRIHRLLCEYTKSRLRSIKETEFEYGAHFVHKLLKKRLFSSPAAFSTTLEKHRESLSRPRKDSTRSRMDDRILKKAILRAEEEYADDGRLEETLQEVTVEASRHAPTLSDEQRSMLDELSEWAASAAHRADSKADAILSWLDEHLKTRGEWNNNRVILFTEYRATHRWLNEILASHGYGGDRLMALHGGMDAKDREKVKAAFQAGPDDSPVRILLATDAASEGIDLQNHCNYLIHVEIPWNPNVMEQRNGRIDRHGQREKEVFIWHPVGKAYEVQSERNDVRPGDLEGDLEYLMRAAVKVDTIREDLGSVGPVIARQIEEAMLGERDDLDTRVAENQANQAKRMLAIDRKLKERVSRLHERLVETQRENHLSPERIQRSVRVALALAGQPPLKRTELQGAALGTVFEMPMLTGSWARCTEGLLHPHTGKRRPITFDYEVAKGRDDVVLVHLGHRLVQMSLRLLRAEIWSPDDKKRLHRISVRTLPNAEITDPVAIILSRLVVTGADQRRLHEEITLAGGELRDDRFIRITRITDLERWMDESSPADTTKDTLDILTKRFRRHEVGLMKAVETRSQDRLRYLRNTLERRKEKEIEDVVTVLDELAHSIEKELAEPEPEQLELWSKDEREQLKRDEESLRARLERIPEEKENEIANVERRYADPQERTFPVAVVFFVPDTMLSRSVK